MATPWSKVIVENAMPFIDDIRMKEELGTNPALFFRTMSMYVEDAVPTLCRPPHFLQYIQSGLKEPGFADFMWESTSESLIAKTEVPTGKVGYDLFCCTSRTRDEDDNLIVAPYTGAKYDPLTGIVTLPEQDSPGIEYDFDFYKDGEFPDLTLTQRRLMGLAIAVQWDDRFARNWLNEQPKIHDKSFSVNSEANQTRSQTERIRETHSLFNSELRKYEQDCDHARLVSSAYRQRTPLL